MNNINDLNLLLEQFRVLTDSLPQAIHIVDRDLRVVYYNPAFEKLLTKIGSIRPGETILGRKLDEMVNNLSLSSLLKHGTVFRDREELAVEEYLPLNGSGVSGKIRYIPIFDGDQVIQVLTIIDPISSRNIPTEEIPSHERFLKLQEEDNHFTPTDTDQVHLVDRIQRQLNELTMLHAIALAGADASSSDDLIQKATELLEDAFPAANLGVLLVDPEKRIIYPHFSYRASGKPLPPETIREAFVPLGVGLVGTSALTSYLIYAPDVTCYSNYLDIFPETRSELCIPIFVDGSVYGVVNAERDQKDAFSPADEHLLRTFTDQLASALEKLNLIEAERKRREEAETLRDIMSTLSADLNLDDVLSQIIAQLHKVIPNDSVAIFLREEEGHRLVAIAGYYNQASAIGKLYPKDDTLFGTILEIGAPLYIQDVQIDSRFRNWGMNTSMHGWMGVPIISHGKTLGFITLDHTRIGAYGPELAKLAQVFANQAGIAIENARLFEETRQRATELTAFAQVSSALREALHRSDMLPVIVNQAFRIMQANGALFANWDSQHRCGKIELGVGVWQKTNGTHVILGEGPFSQAMEAGKPVLVEMGETEFSLLPAELTANCPYIICLPLSSESHLLGALAVGCQQPVLPQQLRVLTSIADVAGNALHRTTLHEEAEKYFRDLADAYDATIEGWSHALELRDQETEGHARRVVDESIRLAYLLNIPEEQIVHIRRGVLLHDIGKMGIPDSILLKPGPLTEEEWIIMRKHPGYAYELLSPIAHLRPALDIPYCHHEKWDGTGYPRGLKGEEIPFPARIFSIIDVWDALSSNRPYRLAWPVDKTLDYIISQSGKSFDPQVVEAFLEMIEQKNSDPPK